MSTRTRTRTLTLAESLAAERRARILAALAGHDGNASRAAVALGISRRQMARYLLDPEIRAEVSRRYARATGVYART